MLSVLAMVLLLGNPSPGPPRPSTCTGERCTIHDAGTYDDGGSDGVVTALRFVATVRGTGTTAFDCRSEGAASSPCLRGHDIMEIFTVPPNKDQTAAAFPDFLLLSQAPDGGVRVAGYLFGILSGTSAAENPQFAVTWNGGVELNMTNQGGGLTINGAVAEFTAPAGYMRFNSASAGASGPAYLLRQTAGTRITSGNFVEFYNFDGALIAALTWDGVWKSPVGVFPQRHTLSTCSASLEGQVESDVLSGASTGKRTKHCLCTSDGAAAYKWQNLATGTLGTTTTCGSE